MKGLRHSLKYDLELQVQDRQQETTTTVALIEPTLEPLIRRLYYAGGTMSKIRRKQLDELNSWQY